MTEKELLLKKNSYKFEDLLVLMDVLRSKDGGCPWDAEQDHRSIRNSFIEEVYEAVEAIDDEDDVHLCEELGDVLFSVVFHAAIAKSEGSFDIDDVLNGICRKMIHRHPHVFGQVVAHDSQTVLKNWDEIKKEEKSQRSQADVLRSVSRTLPSLMRAQKLMKKCEKLGHDKSTHTQSWLTHKQAVLDQLQQIEALQGERRSVSDQLGELLLSVVGLCSDCDVDAEESLYFACNRFIDSVEKESETKC